MKKTALLNVALSRTIAGMGHGDILVIGDAGLPVPPALVEIERLKGKLGKREWLSHDDFKVLSRSARAVVRTGECQPYSNIALISGVTF